LVTTNSASIKERDDAKAKFEAARATCDAAVAAVTLAQRKFDDTRLYAPSDGTVENRILQPGDMASPSTPVFTIARQNPLWVRTYVPERELGRVRLGLSATISTDSYPERVYQGWIGFISPTAEFTPKTVETPELRTALVYQMRVYVCDARGELRLGMPATVHIDLSQPPRKAPPGCGTSDAAK
jgi:HlyD family secretion protein